MNAILTCFVGVSQNKEQFAKVTCVISQSTTESLLGDTPPKFIEIIINDGERMILQTDNINNIQQVF